MSITQNLVDLLIHCCYDESGVEDRVGRQRGPDEPWEEDGQGEEDALVLLVLQRQRPVDLSLGSVS